MIGIGLGLLSAASWGAGDFCGGIASKRAGLYSVVITSQVVGLALMAILAILTGQTIPPLEHWLGGAVAGLVGVVGLLALYRALSTGRMGLAAPVSALAAGVLPVLTAFFTLGLPGTLKIVGFALGLVAVWLVSRTESGSIRLSDLALPLLAGASFGLFYVLMSQVSSVSILWPLVAARMASLFILLGYTHIARQARWVGRPLLAVTGLAGALDAGGNAFFVAAAAVGRLDIAAVLSSLFPASTVLLAWLFLHEPISRSQLVGVGVALLAILLISLPG